ncbi:SpoIIE family protein phosphatase [Streptomyces sp. NPDC002514]|uniref:SpoIIE family protein phosphatase n=1 Tax=Streptomyces sp. NPDC001270 TaxID=3364554 RepID=UPI003698790E
MTAEPFRADGILRQAGSRERYGLLDVLGVAAVVLDSDGRIVFWSAPAEDLFGYSAEEALGKYAGRLLVHEADLDLVISLFAEVMETGVSWAGAFPVRHRDGGTRLVEFRNMRLLDHRGAVFALGIAADYGALRRVETDLALSERLVSQSPIGLSIQDKDLRYLTVNPALERINGIPAEASRGRSLRDLLPDLDADYIEGAMRRVLETGRPLIDRRTTGRTPADPDHDHAWSVSYFRLEDSGGQVLGVAGAVVDITERHRAAQEAERARRRLALIADASARIGTTLDVNHTARELAEVVVPELADVAAVDVLDSVLSCHPVAPAGGPALMRSLALVVACPSAATRTADLPGEPVTYAADRLLAECVHTARPVLVPHVTGPDLKRIARDPASVPLLARAGVHSYLAVPLIARGEVLGALDLKRTRNPLPFTEDDVMLAGDLASRAAVSIDNARWFQCVRNTAVTLQRSLLPEDPPRLAGLEVASRYRPAHAASEVGGDWFDTIALADGRTVLVVGDVMGSGIDAAATMGRLRTAARTLAVLDFDPAQVLHHLDRTASGLEHYIATCLYAVYDPARGECHLANAGHLPPVLVRGGRLPELLDLPTGVPLGVGGVTFLSSTVDLDPGDLLVLYTDGLIETRHDAIDDRLDTLLGLLDGPDRPLEETCDRLLAALRTPDDRDDATLLIARTLRAGRPADR